MSSQKRYFHDRLILLLLTTNVFFVVINALLVLFRLGGGKTTGYIVQYRSNLGLSAYKAGEALDLVAFVVFAAAVFTLNLLISIKVYHVRRSVAVMALGLSLIILTVCLIVSNALLVLR